MFIQQKGRILAVAAVLSLSAAGCQGEEPLTPAGETPPVQDVKAGLGCVDVFPGIKSCALGGAVLRNTGKGIDVSGLEKVGSDGISSTFPRASSWRRSTAIAGLGDKAQGLELLARDGSQVVGSLRVGLTGGDQLVLMPRFPNSTGSTYRAHVYTGGRLVSTLTGINYDDYDRFMRPWWWDHANYWYPVDVGFHDRLTVFMDLSSSVVARSWSIRGGPDAFSVEVGGRLVSGDTLEFVEEPKGATTYTGFTAVDVTAGATGMSALDESTIPRAK